MKHTKGPWVAYAVDDPFMEYTHIILSDTAGAVGYSPKESERDLGFTRFKKEDAHLIAAAPEMYDAIKSMCRAELELGTCLPSDCERCPMNKVLKKARGES